MTLTARDFIVQTYLLLFARRAEYHYTVSCKFFAILTCVSGSTEIETVVKVYLARKHTKLVI